ncbi:unnamed protein product [marine sediment metagenome]|uniref:Uncharacterized protein n=1 Tax=marine sediment metagenome TaxID=412755 RepID=X0ZAX8_9ZZZZ
MKILYSISETERRSSPNPVSREKVMDKRYPVPTKKTGKKIKRMFKPKFRVKKIKTM